MSIKLVQERLISYGCKSEQEEGHAIREITQELILAALGRTDFFKCGIFQGGTCLRVFYGLNRFSEDLDFILRKPDLKFNMQPYLQALTDELRSYGYNLEIIDRSRADNTLKKTFIKDNSVGKILRMNYSGKAGPSRKLAVKLEIDSNPPSGSMEEIKYLDFPFISSVVVQDRTSLFAGKIHALLCREYVKGRDWYDFLWYSGRNFKINHGFLASALKQNGPWKGRDFPVDDIWCRKEIGRRIRAIDWAGAAEDVRRFVRDSEQESLALWSRKLFLSQLDKYFKTQLVFRRKTG